MVGRQFPRELNFAEFVQAYIHRVSQLPDHCDVEFDEPNASIRYEYQGNTYFVRPQNAYRDYLKDPSHLDAILDSGITTIFSGKTMQALSLSEAASLLMPMVRDYRYLDITMLIIKTSGQNGALDVADFPFRALSGELAVTLNLDSPTAIRMVGNEELASWGLSFEAALEIAMKNLRRRTTDSLEKIEPGLFISRWNDAYDATRVLLADLFLRLPLRGEPVVCLPSRNVLLVTGSEDATALSALTRKAAEILTSENRPLSADVLQFDGNRWIEAAPSVRQAPMLVKARHQLLHRDYAQQTGLLDKLHVAMEKSIFVANYRLGTKKGEEALFNYTQLTEGSSPTLLPKADHLAFWTNAKEMLVLPWSDAAQVLDTALKKQDMHLARYLVESFPDLSQLSVLRTRAVIAVGPPDPKKDMPIAAEKFRQAYQEQFKKEINYDPAGLGQLEAFVQGQHEQGLAPTQANVEGPGAFLGEFIIRHLGGEWTEYEDTIMVRFDDGSGVFPFAKVAKQLANGAEGGDSVSGLYETTKFLRDHEQRALTEAQKRLASFSHEISDHHIFIASTLDSSRPWARVESILEDGVRIGKTGLSKFAEITEDLKSVSSYCVFRADTTLVHAEALPAELAAMQPPELLHYLQSNSVNDPQYLARAFQPYQVAAHPPEEEMERCLHQVRVKFSSLQKSAPQAFESMRAAKPQWLKESDPLFDICRQQMHLLGEGKIVWAALVMANNLMFRPGQDDCPGLLVYSLDPYFDERPQELRAIAHKIFELKESTPEDPALQAIAKLVTEETDRSMGWKVPEAFTDKDVRAATFLVFRKHIPRGVLHGPPFPILVHPSTQAVMIVPHEAWPVKLIGAWWPAGGTRYLEEIRLLPEGIRVTHTPDPVSAVMRGNEFVWEYQTTIEALKSELSILEFGAFTLHQGEWRFTNSEPFSSRHFAEWYKCQNADLSADVVLRAGMPAVDHQNWSRSQRLRSTRTLWYYIGQDPSGRLFRGEAEVMQRGTLVHPDSAPASALKTSGGQGVISRLLGKSVPKNPLRFDGVYRAKQQPNDEADQNHCYLRLFPDGTALYTTSAENPAELERWFNKKNEHVPIGDYKIKGEELRIEIRAVNTTLVFSGTIGKNQLVLSSQRFSNNPTVTDEFLFMGWRP